MAHSIYSGQGSTGETRYLDPNASQLYSWPINRPMECSRPEETRGNLYEQTQGDAADIGPENNYDSSSDGGEEEDDDGDDEELVSEAESDVDMVDPSLGAMVDELIASEAANELTGGNVHFGGVRVGAGRAKGKRRQPLKDDEQKPTRKRRGKPGGTAKGVKKGFRKPLEPTEVFKSLISQASNAFIDNDYDTAEELVSQAILENPEIFNAHALLSEIHLARGDRNRAVTALFHGAHTRPRDVETWTRVAELILERAGADRDSAIPDAIYCHNRVLGAHADHYPARYARAALHREQDRPQRAFYDYEYILKLRPSEIDALRNLVEVTTDANYSARAVQRFDATIAHYKELEGHSLSAIDWSDANNYAAVLIDSGQYRDGLVKLKGLFRLLLGRAGEDFWDEWNEDDREFDAEDNPRRFRVPEFEVGRFEAVQYGQGLPLDLRIKLGVCRLKLGKEYLEEAANHFAWLDLDMDAVEGTVFDFPDLFRETADAFRLENLFEDALKYYEQIQHVEDHADVTLFLDMATCYRALKMYDDAEQCYKIGIENTEYDVPVRDEVIRMFEEAGMPERAAPYLVGIPMRRAPGKDSSLVPSRRWKKNLKSAPINAADIPLQSTEDGDAVPLILAQRRRAPRVRRTRSQDGRRKKQVQQDNLSSFFQEMGELRERIRNGDLEAREDWMENTHAVTEKFRAEKVFYVGEKHLRFAGYGYQPLKGNTAGNEDGVNQKKASDGSVPDDYCDVKFTTWLDLFCEYALELAKDGEMENAYATLRTASDANVWYHSKDAMFLIHITWSVVALIFDDSETLCNCSRYLMKEFQFVTDTYRLFATLNRLSSRPNNWYNNGPTQKFILRQLKAIDYALMGDTHDKNDKTIFQDRAGLSSKDENGNTIHPTDFDVVLLMIYGHILYAGKSYQYGLNYFFRAYALDPENAMIQLYIALGYIHYGLKRQSSNRHYLVMQGFAFLFKYYDKRSKSELRVERQEAEYNMGRAYQILGLSHLAIPYYERSLELSSTNRKEPCTTEIEDFASHAAYALQSIWAVNGQVELARAVTEDWLVL